MPFHGFPTENSRSISPRWPACRTRFSGKSAKRCGADVLVTEFVSAEGVFRRNERTREYLDFDEIERPIGVQLFGGNARTWRKLPDTSSTGFARFYRSEFRLSGQQSRREKRRLGLLKDCPTSGRRGRGSRARRRAASSDREDSHRLGRRFHQRAACRATSRDVGHRCASRSTGAPARKATPARPTGT